MSDLIEQENASERFVRGQKRVLNDEQVRKADIEWARKPEWLKANETGDRMSDGSDDQEYEEEDE